MCLRLTQWQVCNSSWDEIYFTVLTKRWKCSYLRCMGRIQQIINIRYACECRPGYAGDGLNCVKTAENPTKENWDEEEGEMTRTSWLRQIQMSNSPFQRNIVRRAWMLLTVMVMVIVWSTMQREDTYANVCPDSRETERICAHSLVSFLPCPLLVALNQFLISDQCNPTDTHTCTQNAECVYGERERAYVCKCVQGMFRSWLLFHRMHCLHWFSLDSPFK